MTDINKQIEEEAREFAFKSCPYHYSDCEIEHCNSNCQWHRYSQQDDSYKKFKQGAQFVLNSSRWRKVSEGLPEVKDENFFINIKRYDNEFRIDTICVFAEMEDVKGYLEFNNVDSWKPID